MHLYKEDRPVLTGCGVAYLFIYLDLLDFDFPLELLGTLFWNLCDGIVAMIFDHTYNRSAKKYFGFFLAFWSLLI